MTATHYTLVNIPADHLTLIMRSLSKGPWDVVNPILSLLDMQKREQDLAAVTPPAAEPPRDHGDKEF